MQVQVLFPAPNARNHYDFGGCCMFRASLFAAFLALDYFLDFMEGYLVSRISLKQVEGLGSVALERAIQEFLRNCRLRNLSPRTIEYYEEDLRYFQRNTDIVNADELRRETLENFIGHEIDKGNRITAINTRLRGLRVFVNFCAERNYIEGFKYALL